MNYYSVRNGIDTKLVLKILKAVYEISVILIKVYSDCKKGLK